VQRECTAQGQLRSQCKRKPFKMTATKTRRQAQWKGTAKTDGTGVEARGKSLEGREIWLQT
jgi:hypothetical protein